MVMANMGFISPTLDVEKQSEVKLKTHLLPHGHPSSEIQRHFP